MLTNDGKRKLMAGGMFGLPMALVLITARMVGGPGNVEAGETPGLALAAISVDGAAVAPPSPDQVAAADRIADLGDEIFGPTPFHHLRAGETPIEVDDEGDADAPRFRVKLIMAASTGNRALINGKVYTVGDELGDTGWEIITINAQSRSVTIRDPETDRLSTGTVAGPSAD